MDNIERTLGQLFEGRDFEKEYQGLKQQVLHYQPIQDFFKEHKEEVTEQLVNQNLSNLYEFMTQHKKIHGTGRNYNAWLCTKTCS